MPIRSCDSGLKNHPDKEVRRSAKAYRQALFPADEVKNDDPNDPALAADKKLKAELAAKEKAEAERKEAERKANEERLRKEGEAAEVEEKKVVDVGTKRRRVVRDKKNRS